MKKKTCLFILALIFCTQNVLHAKDTFSPSILNDFFKVTKKLYENEEYQNPLDQILDGSSLLLQPRSEKVILNEQIYSIKHNNSLYISLIDFANALDFAIDFEENQDFAKGWFIKEDWLFQLDLNQKTVSSKGRTHKILNTDTVFIGNTLFVKIEIVANWFELAISLDIAEQYIDISSSQPLAFVSRNLRKKRNPRSQNLNGAKLPFLEQEKLYFDINSLDVSVGSSYRKNELGKTDKFTNSNIITQGEILKHNAFASITSDNRNQITNIVSRLELNSEKNDLLGPLNAASYQIGDIDVTDIPLTGRISQDLGIRFDNSPIQNSDFLTTNIEGDSIPGWDIELYRNGILIDNLTVNDNGRYVFNEVPLFVDDNEFELFFYGTQGELRSEKVVIPISQNFLLDQDNTYEVSFTFEETQTLQKFQAEDEDRNSLNVSAKYNKALSKNSIGFIGLRSRQILGDRINFLSLGMSSIIGANLVDSNYAITSNGEFSSETTLRRNVLGWDLFFRGQNNSKNFIIDDTIDPTTIDLSFNGQKKAELFDYKDLNLLLNSRFRKTKNNAEIKNFDFGISTHFFDINASNRLIYEKNNIGNQNEESLDNLFSLRKSYDKLFLRGSSRYEFGEGLRSFTGQINYKPFKFLSTDVIFDRSLINNLNTTRLNLNYINKYFSLSPFLEWNSEDRIFTGLNLTSSISDSPGNKYPEISSKRQIGKGGIQAFVYHDKNGNNIFDNTDEPIEGAVIESLNIRRSIKTNENGFAIMKDLPPTSLTDIILDKSSIPDPFLISTYNDGVSILPQAGSMRKIEFPLHSSGEIEGNIFFLNKEREKIPLPFTKLSLTPLHSFKKDQVIYSKTNNRGEFLFFPVPPGEYILQLDPLNNNSNLADFGPNIVRISYGGDLLKETNLVLKQNSKQVPYGVERLEIPENIWLLKIKKFGESDLSKVLYKHFYNKFLLQKIAHMEKVGTKIENGYEYDFYVSKDKKNNDLHKACSSLLENNISCQLVYNLPEATNES